MYIFNYYTPRWALYVYILTLTVAGKLGKVFSATAAFKETLGLPNAVGPMVKALVETASRARAAVNFIWDIYRFELLSICSVDTHLLSS